METSQWLAHVRTALDRGATEVGADWHLEIVAANGAHARGGRAILRATAPDGKRSVILKTYAQPGSAVLRYNSLGRLRAKTDCVVAPLFVLAEHNLFAMADLGPRTLLDDVPKHGMEACVARAATWLRRYANDLDRGARPLTSAPLLKSVETGLSRLPAPHWPQGRALVAALAARFDPFEGRPVRHIEIFGDLTLENLCLPAGAPGPVAVDHVHGGIMPVERDLAFLLHWCRARLWRGALYGRGRVAWLRRWVRPGPDAIFARCRGTAIGCFSGDLNTELLDAYTQAFAVEMWGRVVFKNKEPQLLGRIERELALI